MTDLIARLETATEPDRELDREIVRAIGRGVEVIRVPKDHPVFKKGGGLEFMVEPDGTRVGIPHYTASIDAALTLVPKGDGQVCWEVSTWTNYPQALFHTPKPAGACIERHGNKPDGLCDLWVDAHAFSPALAVCAAAFMAREAMD